MDQWLLMTVSLLCSLLAASVVWLDFVASGEMLSRQSAPVLPRETERETTAEAEFKRSPAAELSHPQMDAVCFLDDWHGLAMEVRDSAAECFGRVSPARGPPA